MELKGEVLGRVKTYESLSRWEKSELGRDLRRLGLSYGEIMELIPVKKSTLATWCRDVKLADTQIAAIKKRTGENAKTPDTGRKRRAEIAELRAIARQSAEELFDDPAWVADWSCIGPKGRRLEIVSAWPTPTLEPSDSSSAG
ncbi:MAG TPA: hypothetical protein VE569_01765 [Acidimicrobiia bacterium]|jgi:hypothetical protein|nr:hypothetical protein [Acidimicrobiia bacterium]